MSLSIEERLKIISNKVGDLNEDGEVKSFGGNENGYAKIIPIKHKKSGIAAWIHHWKDGRLIIDLIITAKASVRYEAEAKLALEIFKKFAGDKLKKMPFTHSVDMDESDVYYLDVTNFSVEKLDSCVDNLIVLYEKSVLA